MARLDLDALLPDGHELVKGGRVYRLPGDVPVPYMLRAAKLTEEVRSPDTTPERRVELTAEIYENALDLFRVYEPALDAIPLSAGELGALNAMMATGFVNPDGLGDFLRAIRDALVADANGAAPAAGADGGADDEEEEGADPTTPPAAAAGRSRKRSRAPSSASA